MGATELPEPGAILDGRFQLAEKIGIGGMGDVWIARNLRTSGDVAIKTLHPSERATIRGERLRQEARLASTVAQRNIVRVYDLLDDGAGSLALVMELLRGHTLASSMRIHGRFTAAQAVAVACAVLAGLQHAHDLGIVHRDVKPGNIFLALEPDGHVVPKLLDFGIAKVPAAKSALTLESEVLGTPRYMSPEQIRSKEELDGRSDQFSLAVLLYEMLTGTAPFDGASPSATLAAVLEEEVDPDPTIDPRLWLVIARALAKQPYERFASAREFAAALQEAIGASDEELVSALKELKPPLRSAPPSNLAAISAVTPARIAMRRPRVHGALAVGAVGFAAFGVTMLVFAIHRAASDRSEGARPQPSAEVAASEVAPGRVAIPPVPPPDPPVDDTPPPPEKPSPANTKPAPPDVIELPEAPRGATKHGAAAHTAPATRPSKPAIKPSAQGKDPTKNPGF